MRSKSFIYAVESEGEEVLVRAISPGRAVKAVVKPSVRRATADEVATAMQAGATLIDATKEVSHATSRK